RLRSVLILHRQRAIGFQSKRSSVRLGLMRDFAAGHGDGLHTDRGDSHDLLTVPGGGGHRPFKTTVDVDPRAGSWLTDGRIGAAHFRAVQVIELTSLACLRCHGRAARTATADEANVLNSLR